MKKIYILSLFLLLTATTTIFAQKETYNWIFGQNTYISWNNPQSLPATGVMGTSGSTTLNNLPGLTAYTSPMDTHEGCFALSDANGNLMFFSDGQTVWKKDMSVMTNGTGLLGHISSAQSGIIIPFPGSTSKYIIISAGYTDSNVLVYSVVDMAAQSGDGEVVSTQKNKPFQGAVGGFLGESVMAVRHANGRDYWIVAPTRSQTAGGSYFNVWLITPSGVQASAPVKTAQIPGVVLYNTTIAGGDLKYWQNCGYLKMSPNGKHLAWGTWTSGRYLIVANFDNATGAISSVKSIPTKNTNSLDLDYYGVEFSKDGKYLFTSSNSTTYTNYIRIWDFDALVKASNPSTVTPVTRSTSGSNTWLGAMQMGPDNRIYVATYTSPYSSYLYVIDKPDLGGTAPIYQLPSGLLGTGRSRTGLPSFSASWWMIPIVPISGNPNLCQGDSDGYRLTIPPSATDMGVAYTIWDWGDGNIENPDTSITPGTVQEYTHTYSTVGTYIITVRAYNSSNVLINDWIANLEVKVSASPTILVNNATVCYGDNATLSVTPSAGAIVKWYLTQDASETPFLQNTNSYTINNATVDKTYYVEAENGDCSTGRVPISLTVGQVLISIPNTSITVCAGERVSLSGSTNNYRYTTIDWYTTPTGGTPVLTGNPVLTPVFNTPQSITYYAEGRDTQTGCVSLTRTEVTITVVAKPLITSVTPDVAICTGTKASLSGVVQGGDIIDWYTVPFGGLPVFSSDSGVVVQTANLDRTTVYYAEARATTSGCVSVGRTKVTVTVKPCVMPVNPNIHLYTK